MSNSQRPSRATAPTTAPTTEPSEWVTGDDPMTDAQASYLRTLARQAGEEPETDELTKAEASEKIDELRDKAGIEQTHRG